MSFQGPHLSDDHALTNDAPATTITGFLQESREEFASEDRSTDSGACRNTLAPHPVFLFMYKNLHYFHLNLMALKIKMVLH